MMDPEIPKNEGFFDSDRAVVPQGCVLNPHAGQAGVSAGTHHPGADVGEVIAVAMQHVLPDKAVPQTYKTGIPTIIVGVDPRTGAVVHRPLGRGLRRAGATRRRAWTRGARQNAAFGNLWKATAEINESLYPHVQWSRDYRTDSGGPGQWRGLCGSHYEKEVRVDAKVYTYVVGMKYPMPGICGGKPGAPNELIIRYGSDDPYVVQHTADWVPIGGRRSASCYDYGGGGGWGDPLDRDPQAVLDDVLDEYVSRRGRRAATTASCSPARSTTSRSRSTTTPPTAQRAERRDPRSGDRRIESHGLPGRGRRRGHVHRPHLRHARRARSCSTRRRPRSTTSRSA